jgi:gliding-associated putative ABC transporter substrate-binding component GldG
MKNKKSTSIYILLTVAILVLVNVLSDQFSFRLDLTQEGRYTLSKATKDILKNLDEPVTVKAYFTKKDLPPQYLKVREDFKEMLVEFNEISGGNVVYKFIDPNEKEELEQEAMQNGIQPVQIQVREKDQMKVIKAYLGAILTLGDNTERIPFMNEGAAMEYALATSIKKISVSNKPKVGFIQGHGEPTLAELQQASFALSILYDVEEIELSDSINLSQYKTLAIVAPRDSFPMYQFSLLDNYLANGGNIYIGMNRVDADLQTQQAAELNTGLESWLQSKGLTVENNVVVDNSCATINVTRQQGFFRFNQPMRFVYFPTIRSFEDHPITKGLEQVIIEVASTMSYTGDTSVQFTPILKTSEKSSTLSTPLTLDINKNWAEKELSLSNLNIGGVLDGKIVGNMNSKIVVISDGDFPVNGEGQQAQQKMPDNVSLFVNSIDWLSDDTGLIELRTKGITARPLDEIEDGKKQFLKWLNFLLPILLIIIYGVYRAQRRKNLRIRRMQEGYIY